MAFDPQTIQERSSRAQELMSDLRAKGVRVVQMEMPDINGTMRGKVASLAKGLAPAGTGMSSLVMSFRSADDISLTSWSDMVNGYPKITALPDFDTLTTWPWRPDTAAVMCDFYMDDGSPCPLDGRQALRRVIAEFEALGIEPRAAIEWEFYLYADNDELLRAGRHRELLSLGRQLHCYTLTNSPSFEPFATEFIERMEDVGVTVEAFHSEYGRGQYEFTCHHAPALKAADDATRAKTYLKQLASERGLVATFMPAIHVTTADARNGAHVNISIWKDGKNAFWDEETASLSELARQSAAGMMETMPDFHLFFRPYVNSYRRMDRISWNPEDASWGVDNHSVAIRVVHGSEPAKLTRFEHRAPGSDLNPYHAIASMLWGALQGIKGRLTPPEFAIGDPFDAIDRYLPLPHSLPDSVAAFRSSARAREMLGDTFVDHFSTMKSDEWEAYASWLKENSVDESETTDWEFSHYFEWI